MSRGFGADDGSSPSWALKEAGGHPVAGSVSPGIGRIGPASVPPCESATLLAMSHPVAGSVPPSAVADPGRALLRPLRVHDGRSHGVAFK
eukprot:9836009-Heterocapsa_arctica.AAC.1